MHNFKKLKVWEKSHKFVLEIYKLTDNFPKHEQYNLVSQMRRCAYSIPSNIVEGSLRKSNKDFLHFLNISVSSASELWYHLLLTKDLKYIELNKYSEISEECEYIIKQLVKLIQSHK